MYYAYYIYIINTVYTMPTRYATYTMYTIFVGYLRGEKHRIWGITSDIEAHLGTSERGLYN